MDLPPFEGAMVIIKKFETLHKPEHWPYVGYGHQVQPGEPYRRGVQLTEKQADALLRKDLRKSVSLYKSYGKDALLLGVLAYNCGPGVVNKSTVLKKTESRQPRHLQVLYLLLPLQRHNSSWVIKT